MAFQWQGIWIIDHPKSRKHVIALDPSTQQTQVWANAYQLLWWNQGWLHWCPLLFVHATSRQDAVNSWLVSLVWCHITFSSFHWPDIPPNMVTVASGPGAHLWESSTSDVFCCIKRFAADNGLSQERLSGCCETISHAFNVLKIFWSNSRRL